MNIRFEDLCGLQLYNLRYTSMYFLYFPGNAIADRLFITIAHWTYHET